jgi:hypothetical protein
MFQAEAVPHFSLLREFIAPAFFTVLGAVLGFFASYLRDECKAGRAKKSFLRAVGMELDALGDQLDASLNEVQGALQRVQSGGTGPQFSFALRTSVYSSQVGKVQDIDDPLLIEVVHFYSDLGTLEGGLKIANQVSAEFSRGDPGMHAKDLIRRRLNSSLIELENQTKTFAERLRKTRAKLPPAEKLAKA